MSLSEYSWLKGFGTIDIIKIIVFIFRDWRVGLFAQIICSLAVNSNIVSINSYVIYLLDSFILCFTSFYEKKCFWIYWTFEIIARREN